MTDGPHIFAVSANERNVELLAGLLRERDYRVTTATSLDDVEQFAASPADASLALVDTDGFPDGIWDECKRLRQSGVPFIVLSLHADADRTKSQDHGARDILEKPVGQRDLLGLIQHLVGEE